MENSKNNKNDEQTKESRKKKKIKTANNNVLFIVRIHLCQMNMYSVLESIILP